MAAFDDVAIRAVGGVEPTGLLSRDGPRATLEVARVSRITAPDFAIAVVDELENPGNERHFTVAQGSAS